jgi:hypothetical protein
VSSPYRPGRRRYTPEQAVVRARERNARYYAKAGRPGPKPWTREEDTLITVMQEGISDHDLAKATGRSIHAIDNRRYKLRHENTTCPTASKTLSS